jgi:hypothetical protein
MSRNDGEHAWRWGGFDGEKKMIVEKKLNSGDDWNN